VQVIADIYSFKKRVNPCTLYCLNPSFTSQNEMWVFPQHGCIGFIHLTVKMSKYLGFLSQWLAKVSNLLSSPV